MQRLVHVSDEMHQQYQSLLFIFDRERRRRSLVAKNGNGRADGGDQVVFSGASCAALEAIALNRYVIEMVDGVASARRLIPAVGPVSFRVVLHPAPLRFQGCARHFIFQVLLIDFIGEHIIGLAPDAPDTIGPWADEAQSQFAVRVALVENVLDLLGCIAVAQEFVGDRTGHAVALETPGRSRIRSEKENQAANGKQQSQHHRLAELAR